MQFTDKRNMQLATILTGMAFMGGCSSEPYGKPVDRTKAEASQDFNSESVVAEGSKSHVMLSLFEEISVDGAISTVNASNSSKEASTECLPAAMVWILSTLIKGVTCMRPYGQYNFTPTEDLLLVYVENNYGPEVHRAVVNWQT